MAVSATIGAANQTNDFDSRDKLPNQRRYRVRGRQMAFAAPVAHRLPVSSVSLVSRRRFNVDELSESIEGEANRRKCRERHAEDK